jgi:hypothetical protein
MRNEELHNLYTLWQAILEDQVKDDEIGEACGMNGEEKEEEKANRLLGGESEGERPLRRKNIDV